MTKGLRVPMLVLLLLWMVLLGVLGFTRLVAVPTSDKALHFVGFGVMSILVFFSFQAAIPRRKVWVLTSVCMGVACFFSEVMQRLLTTRTFEWSDILSNFLGTFTFLFAAWMVDKWIIQPRAGRDGGYDTRYQDSTQYLALNTGAARSPRRSFGDGEDELDVELDEILAGTPPQLQAARE
ncbi:hypothetical protein GGI26_003563 [Coemansia sp. RSA 1358]|nr:hypothetical protein BX070DRAFT_253353 [Coemansia spiralis]KAJ2622121.1 hypothetical protein GGI26_003563 [Coemansia sp. RSA 1358]